jgi:hypothetical protein
MRRNCNCKNAMCVSEVWKMRIDCWLNIVGGCQCTSNLQIFVNEIVCAVLPRGSMCLGGLMTGSTTAIGPCLQTHVMDGVRCHHIMLTCGQPPAGSWSQGGSLLTQTPLTTPLCCLCCEVLMVCPKCQVLVGPHYYYRDSDIHTPAAAAGPAGTDHINMEDLREERQPAAAAAAVEADEREQLQTEQQQSPRKHRCFHLLDLPDYPLLMVGGCQRLFIQVRNKLRVADMVRAPATISAAKPWPWQHACCSCCGSSINCNSINLCSVDGSPAPGCPCARVVAEVL